MEGFLHSMLGMNKISKQSDQERERTHNIVNQMELKRQAQNRYKNHQGPERKNIFEDNAFFYNKCIDLETKVKKLERANKYLIQQVISTMTMKGVVDSRKNSSNNFVLETGISVESGSGDSGK